MVYLDSSALLRFFDSDHPSSDAIVSYLDENDLWEEITISNLNDLECERVAVREFLHGESDRADAIRAAMLTITAASKTVYIDKTSVGRAAEIPYHLKSLDALHLGLAMGAGSRIIITYDQQMINAANQLKSNSDWKGLNNFEVVSP